MSARITLSLLTLLALPAAGQAPERLALFFGQNTGASGRVPLRYAEADAARVQRAMLEAGAITARDSRLVKAATVRDVLDQLTWARQRVEEVHSSKGHTALLYVYLSAHGHEGDGLELGTQVLSWAQLKQAVNDTAADARVTIIDSCQSSGALKVSGRVGEGFTIAAEDRLTVTGEALIASSAEDEPSLEAGAWRGSVFTHHLVAGLRGGADQSGDRKVSLEELYRYAYERTADGQSGQHPGYSFKLQGHGELVVSDLSRASATLTVPAGLDGITVTDSSTGDSVLEARHSDGRMFALGPGRYDLRVLKSGEARAAQVTLEPSDRRLLLDDELRAAPLSSAQLVRLDSSVRFCLGALKAERPDPVLEAALTAMRERLQHLPEQACAEGAPRLDGSLKREARAFRFEATLGASPIALAAPAERLVDEVAAVVLQTVKQTQR